jgi:DNA-binding NarL/FixJ family response regulator
VKNKFSFCRGGINPNLTRRELDVLYLVGHGSPVKECAWTLGISAKTCSRHLSNIMFKLQVHSRYELVIEAAKRGLHRELKFEAQVVEFRPAIQRAA